MEIRIHNPKYPKDKARAKALTQEQFAVVHDVIVAYMNRAMGWGARRAGKQTAADQTEATIIRKLEEAGMPIQFDNDEGEDK